VKPSPTGVFKIARQGDAVYTRVVGLGTMNNSITFKEFGDQQLGQGYRRFIIDLADCKGIDSTFMGILAGLAASARAHDKRPGSGVIIVNANPHCRKQLESIGLHRIVTVQNDPAALPAGLELHELPESEASPTARLKLIMRAHQELIAADKKNEERFGAFLRDIAKNLGQSPP